jgi:hypothetical protein
VGGYHAVHSNQRRRKAFGASTCDKNNLGLNCKYTDIPSGFSQSGDTCDSFKVRPDCSCSYVSVNVYGFASPSSSITINWSHGLERLATVSVE